MSAAITRKTYTFVFAWLMLLLVLTAGASALPFQKWNLPAIGILIAMGIAAVKAILVVLYFMHVRHGSTVTRIFIVVSLFWLLILVGLTLNDYLTRSWTPVSSGWPP